MVSSVTLTDEFLERSMGRPPIGKHAMSGAERQRRYLARLLAGPSKHEIKQIILGAMSAGARVVELRLGAVSVLIRAFADDDEESTVEANVKEQTAEPEKRISL